MRYIKMYFLIILIISLFSIAVTADAKVKDDGNANPQTKIANELNEKIVNMKENEKLRVAIWVKDDEIRPIKRLEIKANGDIQTLDEVEKNIKSQLMQIHNEVSKKQKPVRDYLKSEKVDILYESIYVPIIFAELSQKNIKNLDIRNDVESMDLGRKYERMIDSSVPAIIAPPAWPLISGGTKVAVVEDDGINFLNPYLKDGIYYVPSNPNIDQHATGIAGIIASTHNTYRGVAYKGPALLSANSQTLSDQNLIAATDWAISQGARVLSNSWGACTGESKLSPLAKYYDRLIYETGVTVIFSAGNCGTYPYPINIVGDPARAYNVIAVGSFDDFNTGLNWGDDYMSSFSSFANPPSPHNDREKPEVVAVGSGGTGIISTSISSSSTISPWIDNIGSGTSYAAPHVSGEASLLINTTPLLGFWPETVKAIIIASADHNIEGASRLSDLDGAGGINVFEAHKIAKDKTKIAGIYLNYDRGEPWYSPNFTAKAGQKIRVVIAWDSRSIGRKDVLNANLDLTIQRMPGIAWVQEPGANISASYDNNFEIVEFKAPVTGIYRAKVTKVSWDLKKHIEHLGYAVYVK